MALCWTVYSHTHVESGRHYIGLTKLTMMKRWNQHVYNATKKRGRGCAHFWAAIRKYGPEAFSHEVLATCASVEEANLLEQEKIREFDTTNPEKGFNLAPGGAHTPHPVRNPWDDPEFHARMSSASRQRWSDPALRVKQGSIVKVQMKNPERLRGMSERAKAQFSKPGSRDASVEASRSMWEDPAVRAKYARLWSDSAYRAKCAANLRPPLMLTHCKRGHELTSENLYVSVKGRACRTCRNDARKARRARGIE